MSEAYTELDARLEEVTKAAALLGSRPPRVRDPASNAACIGFRCCGARCAAREADQLREGARDRRVRFI